MKKTGERLIQNLINNIGHPMFFEGYKALMRDEKKVLLNDVKDDLKKLAKVSYQKIKILIGCVLSICFNIIWLLSVPFLSLIKILKKMLLIPSKIKEHQKIIEYVKNHPQYYLIEEELSKIEEDHSKENSKT